MMTRTTKKKEPKRRVSRLPKPVPTQTMEESLELAAKHSQETLDEMAEHKSGIDPLAHIARLPNRRRR